MALKDVLKKAGKELSQKEEKQIKQDTEKMIEKMQQRVKAKKQEKQQKPNYGPFQRIETDEKGFKKTGEYKEEKKPQVWETEDVVEKLPRSEREATKTIQEVVGGAGTLYQIPEEAQQKITSEWEPPNLEDVDERYPLIEPWSYAQLKWDPDEKRLLYHVLEPPLTKEEKKKLEKINEILVDVLDISLMKVTETKKVRKYLEDKLERIIRDYEINLTESQYRKTLYYIYRNFLGLEKIEPLMQDPAIEDISCDGPKIPLFIYHRMYGSIKTNVVFEEDEKLDRFVTKLAQRTGKHVSVAEPLLHGALPDGSRLQATYSAGKEIATKGSTFTIRKFTKDPLTIIDQMNYGTIPAIIAAYLWLTIEHKNSLLISGGTAAGKTAALNSLGMFIPPSKKILSVEDTPELRLTHEHWISKIATSLAQPGEAERGKVTMFDLIRAGLRERPDYVIVGEVRGREAYNLFQAMSTGHPGMATIHADSVQSVINRLKTPPINLSPGLLQHLDVVMVMGFSRIGNMDVRRAKNVVEVIDVDMDTGKPIINEIFTYNTAGKYFEFSSDESYLLNEIRKEKGITSESVWSEIQRRATLLKWMQEKDITNYKEVGQVIDNYYSNPEEIMKKVREEEIE